MDDGKVTTSSKKGSAARFYATQVLYLEHTFIILTAPQPYSNGLGYTCQRRQYRNQGSADAFMIRKDHH